MRLRKLFSLATALGLATALTVPTGAFAHEVLETTVRFSGNYLMADARTAGPVDSIRLDIYDGKIGGRKGVKPTLGTLANAGAFSYRWGPIATDTCWVEVETWTGATEVYEPGTNVVFDSPYAGHLGVSLTLHGQLSEYPGSVHTEEGMTWCEREMEPTSVIDLGSVLFTANASWTSIVEMKGKRPVKVRTSIDFHDLTFDGTGLEVVADPDDRSPSACSMPRKMSVPVYEFIDDH